MLKAQRESWVQFWRSTLANVVQEDTDIVVVERLWGLYDERERAYRGFRKRRLVVGSQGQTVLNPLGRMMLALDAEIRQLEDRVGLSPKSRLQLGITAVAAQRSITDLNRELEYDDGDEEQEDPRAPS